MSANDTESDHTHTELPTPSPAEAIAEAGMDLEKGDLDRIREKQPHPEGTSEEKPEQTTAAVTDFPEGGWRAWATVLGAFLLQFCGFGYTGSFGVYQDFYTETYITNESASTISWIGGVNALLVVGGGIFSGQLYDRGYFYYLLWGGSLLYCFSLFMLSLCQPNHFYQIFLAQGLGMGIGAGTIYVSSIGVVSHYFLKKRALAMTIVASGSSLGAVIHPIMLNNTFYSLGFGNAVRASAGLVTGLSLIACLLMKPRLPPPKKNMTYMQAVKKFARDPPYIFATMGVSVFIVAYYYPLFYLQLDAQLHGLGTQFSFYSIVILNAAAVVGRLAPGFLAHRLGVPNMITVAVFICTILLFATIAIKSVADVVVIGILFGFFSGNYVTLMAPLMAVLSDNMGELGMRMGISFAFAGIGGLVAGSISGAELGNNYEWWKPAVGSGVLAAFAFVSFALMCVTLRRKKLALARTQAQKEEEAGDAR